MKFDKQKKTTKKVSHVVRGKGLREINLQDLRRKLSQRGKGFAVIVDDEKFTLALDDEREVVEAIIIAAQIQNAEEEEAVLTTQEVAELLNVSRPFVVKLIDSGKLKSFKVGSHRRVMEREALDYRRNMRSKQREALDELAAETEALGIEYK